MYNNACMAFVAGKLNGISTKSILRGIRNYRPLGFRQNFYHTGKTTIYADCYNSSAKSVASAIGIMNLLGRKPGERKKTVLGDIAEIDGFEAETYQSIADTLRASDIDVLFTYGPESCRILDYLNDCNITCYHSVNKTEVEEQIRLEVKQCRSVVIMFKASRSMHLESIIRDTFPIAYYKGMLPVWSTYLIWTLKTL